MLKIENYCTELLNVCEIVADNENDKNSIVFNYCYLEKVVIRRKSSEQTLGLTLTNLLDGVYTVAEISKESASDECSRLNVGDDIFAINDQVIVWIT